MPKILGIDKSGVPVGVPMPVPFTARLPKKTLLCDGAIYLVADFPRLANKLGSVYGGDGVVNFGVPDLRGRTPICMDNLAPSGSGQGPAGIIGDTAADVVGGILGEEMHQLSLTELPSHNHDVGPFDAQVVTFSGSGTIYSSDGSGTLTSSDIGGDTAHNNTQPSMAMVWVIPYI